MLNAEISLCNDRIAEEDGQRQERAASELLARFVRQPGVILADEVGMGKTFVAMAVAVSIMTEQPGAGPIVVMSPPSLREKWPRDWEVFNRKCLSSNLQDRFRASRADSGVQFLRLLDNPPERRSHLIFLTHGALNRTLGDGLAKLAVIKRAFKGRSSLAAQRSNFKRFAGKLLGLDSSFERRAPGLLGDLLDRPYESWLKVIQRADERFKEQITDDPVPRHLAEVLEKMSSDDGELMELVKELCHLPLRESSNIETRLRNVRRALNAAMEKVWKLALRRVSFRSPLLVLDEAHHVKNPATRLASLFASEESAADSEYFKAAGPLGGKFERMLFLTATPFQLGHAELVRVLERFEGIAWNGASKPQMPRTEFLAEMNGLGRVLDDAQAAALRLDRAWGRLRPDQVVAEDGTPMDVEQWWDYAQAAEGEGIVAQIADQVRRTEHKMEAAEVALSPWVLRHLKPRHLPGAPEVTRRLLLTGASIRAGGDPSSGLDIAEAVLLPFLLAGRAQTLLAASTHGRALFAEGLASSFEAYLETRSGTGLLDEDADVPEGEVPPELEWYLQHLDLALPKSDHDARSAHPKISATAERAVALWKAGEKVLVFCHYRATGRALRQHISSLLHKEILRIGQLKLPGRSPKQVQTALEDIGNQFLKNENLQLVVTDWLHAVVQPFKLSSVDRDKVVEVIRRFLRTPSFLVRYVPLERSDLANAFIRAVESPDTSQQSLRNQIEEFFQFLSGCVEDERQQFLSALDTVQTGTHFGKDVRAVFDPAEGGTTEGDGGAVLLPNVRLANGEVRSETRLKLLLTFNTPLFPEILIASSVLAEGVDLHRYCRHVIHHDLCWNPSTLEQRSGRVDRIGSKAELVKESILLYLPYLAATQDEKMYRVVRDRERWFQIIMGEQYDIDETSTDRRAERVPLPTTVQRQLSMRLYPYDPILRS
jgi:hypothetical protein